MADDNDQTPATFRDAVMGKLLSRNYHLALIVIAVSAPALWWKKISGGEWVTISTVVLGMFRAGDAFVNWVNNKRGDKDGSS